MFGTSGESIRGSLGGADSAAILQLCADYLDRADHADVGQVSELFHEDATLHLGAAVLRGRHQIDTFFAERAETHVSSERTVRHLGGLPVLRALDEHRIGARSTAAVFAGTGAIPLTTCVPVTVCDFVDVFCRDSEGTWLFSSRRADVLFIGEGAASFARPAAKQEKE